jgi:hypothetical protein
VLLLRKLYKDYGGTDDDYFMGVLYPLSITGSAIQHEAAVDGLVHFTFPDLFVLYGQSATTGIKLEFEQPGNSTTLHQCIDCNNRICASRYTAQQGYGK